jgi:hypothetical protein
MRTRSRTRLGVLAASLLAVSTAVSTAVGLAGATAASAPQFAPGSAGSGFCVGALSATQGFRIRLERCGGLHSFWVADVSTQITITRPDGQALHYAPLEFAADTSISHPLVLTLHPNSRSPQNELFLEQENLSGGEVPDRQLFTLTDPAGPTPTPSS